MGTLFQGFIKLFANELTVSWHTRRIISTSLVILWFEMKALVMMGGVVELEVYQYDAVQ